VEPYQEDYSHVNPNLINWSKHLLQVDALAQDIFKAMGLSGWKVCSARGKNQYASLSSGRKQIQLAANYLARVPMSMIENTLLVHAVLARMGSDTKRRSGEFLRECARWGADPGLKCPVFFPYRWILRCSKGCWHVKRHQRTVRQANRTCNKCGSKCEYVKPGTQLAKSIDGHKPAATNSSKARELARKRPSDEDYSDDDGERAVQEAMAYAQSEDDEEEEEEDMDEEDSHVHDELVIPPHFRGNGSSSSGQPA